MFLALVCLYVLSARFLNSLLTNIKNIYTYNQISVLAVGYVDGARRNVVILSGIITASISIMDKTTRWIELHGAGY